MTVKIDKRTKGYKSGRHRKPDYANETKCGEDFSKCMKCGVELPPNEYGSTSFRKTPECCPDCVWENYGKKVV